VGDGWPDHRCRHLAWWENNSFTPEAIRADELLDQMQGKK
jgi:hypothetical protein